MATDISLQLVSEAIQNSNFDRTLAGWLKRSSFARASLSSRATVRADASSIYYTLPFRELRNQDAQQSFRRSNPMPQSATPNNDIVEPGSGVERIW